LVAKASVLVISFITAALMPKKQNHKNKHADDGGQIFVIMIMSLAILFFFTVYWQQSMCKLFKPEQSSWQTVKNTTIIPRD